MTLLIHRIDGMAAGVQDRLIRQKQATWWSSVDWMNNINREKEQETAYE